MHETFGNGAAAWVGPDAGPSAEMRAVRARVADLTGLAALTWVAALTGLAVRTRVVALTTLTGLADAE
ncbi:MAG: hypothetical protein J2P29_05500 [Actinobacteria bacterium]|nr:hypothetical protein [Actinomycetota bacterium]